MMNSATRRKIRRWEEVGNAQIWGDRSVLVREPRTGMPSLQFGFSPRF